MFGLCSYEGKIIAYASRQLKVHEKNYPTHDLEIAGVVFTLKLWRHNLYGVHVDVFTVHKIPVRDHTELNLRQRRWLEMSKAYDMNVHYHPGKANIVADVLCRMSMGSTTPVEDGQKELVKDIHRLDRLGVRLVDSTSGGVLVHPSSESFLVVEVKEGQHLHHVLMELKDSMLVNMNESFALGHDDILRYQVRVFV